MSQNNMVCEVRGHSFSLINANARCVSCGKTQSEIYGGRSTNLPPSIGAIYDRELKEQQTMSKKYPLTESIMGNVFHAIDMESHTVVIRAEYVEKVLSEGVRLRGVSAECADWCTINQIGDTHEGLLIGVKEIKPKDTAESFLKELIKVAFDVETQGNYCVVPMTREWRDRVKKFLEGK